VALGGEQVHVWLGLAVLDVFAGQHEIEPRPQIEDVEHALNKRMAAARGDSLGDAGRFKGGEQIEQPRHRREPFGEEPAEDLRRLRGELLGGGVEFVVLDHERERDARLAAHHLVHELSGEFLAPPGQDRPADLLV
jgi:hypothetical protein